MEERLMKKRNLSKAKCIILLAASLAAGAVLPPAPTASPAVQAASSQRQEIEKNVNSILKKQVGKKDSKKVKLKKLFTYMQKKYKFTGIYKSDYFKKWVKTKNYTGWEKDFALEMYADKTGSCFHYAAAYAYLAKGATQYNVRIVTGKTNGFNQKLQDHAWVEIQINKKWYIFDPNMDQFAAKSSGK